MLRRFRRPDSLAEGVQPCRGVRDDEQGLVLWLAPGTPVLRPVLADGRDIRDVPLSQRFDYYRHGRATRLDTWRGQGILGIVPPDVPWSVWLFWTEDWDFQGWYVNLEAVQERTSREAATEDHIIDLIVAPDRTVVWKDENELKAAVLGRRFTDEKAEQIRTDGRTERSVGGRAVGVTLLRRMGVLAAGPGLARPGHARRARRAGGLPLTGCYEPAQYQPLERKALHAPHGLP